jgi:hypothetical protein
MADTSSSAAQQRPLPPPKIYPCRMKYFSAFWVMTNLKAVFAAKS